MFLRDHWARSFPSLKQILCKISILFFCLVFSGTALSQTFYDVLGVSKDSAQGEIKKSYRKLVSKWHTDRNKDPNAASKIQEITRAYRVLRDPVQRAEYDRRIGNISGVINSQPPLLTHRQSFGQKARAKGVEFLISYVAFQLALVGHIYREYTTDQAFYDAPRNPDPGEETRRQFGQEGFIQFGIFYLGSEVTRWLLEAGGKKLNWPILTRVAGAAGMGMGYFFSQLVSDVTVDKQVFGECLQSIMDGKVRLRMEVVPIIGPLPLPVPEVDFLGIGHIPPCQEAYLNWIKSGKWEEYGVDIFNMLVASGLAHGFVRGGALGGAALLNHTRTGSSLLSSAGRLAAKFPRVVGFTSPIAIFAMSIYPFIEINDLLDEFVGNPWKEGLLTKNMSSDIYTLNEDFSQLTPEQLSFLTGSTLKAVLKVIDYVHRKKKEANYDPKSIQYLKYLAWDEEGRKVFTSVLYGLDEGELRRLKVGLKHAVKREQRIKDESTPDVLAAFDELQNSVEAFESSEQLTEKELGVANEVLENIISQIKTIGFRFSRWPLLKGRVYQESFSHWKNKTDKVIIPYIEAEQLLSGIYDKTVTIEQLQKQMAEEIVSVEYVGNQNADDTADQGGELSSGEEGSQTDTYSAGNNGEGLASEESDSSKGKAYNKTIEAIKEKYRALINERLKFFTFEEERLEEDGEIYRKFLCPYLEDREVRKKVKEAYLGGHTGWIEWCNQPEQVRLTARPLVYQTLPILDAMLEEKFPDVFSDNSDDSQSDSDEVEQILKNYVSEIPDELFAEGNYHSKQFSGDTQAEAFSLEKADLPTKAKIARAFIEAVERPFPPVSSAVWDNMLEVSCFIERTEDPEKCGEKANKLIREKLAAGAFFLLRDVLSPPRESGLYGVNQAVQEKDMEKYHLAAISDTYAKVSHTGFPLTGFAEVYKGKERRFSKDITLFDPSLPPEMSPYTFLHDFICGEWEGKVRKGWFSAPQMVDFAFRDEDHRHETLAPICDFLNNNHTDSSDKNPGLTLRNRYFHTPIMVNESLYPSVYEMVEDWLPSFYKSEGGKEDVLEIYSSRTKTLIKAATGKMRKDLKTLKANYIVPGMISSDLKSLGRTQCHTLRDYYSSNYEVTEIPPNLFRDGMRIYHQKDQLRLYKGLEIYLFQIQFWMEWMQRVNRVTGAINLLDKDNTETAPSTGDLDKVTCKILELLKQYHDSFVDGTGLAYLTRAEAEEIQNLDISQALQEISSKSFNNDNAPVLLPPELMWSLILKAAYPEKWEDMEGRQMVWKLKPETQQDTLVYALAVELRKSIKGFYGSLNFLYLSDGLEEAVEHKPTGLPLFQ